jgi:phosphoribosyl 1,2-cyclic phosphodiesterase
MKLFFPGTRGEIDTRTRWHRMHSCLLVEGRVLIDCGADWLGKVEHLRPAAIVLTHAHPDHLGGLKYGAPCPVFATSDTWDRVKRYPISERNIVIPRQEFSIATCRFEAFTVEHSLIAPAVGYRISKGSVSVFYVPDLVRIHEHHEALSGVAAYIGDGSSISRPLVRRRDGTRIGHASVREQLDWCQTEKIKQVVITHCGSQIVTREANAVEANISALGRERGLRVIVARDGLGTTVRHSGIEITPLMDC